MMDEDVNYYLDLDYLSEFCSIKIETEVDNTEDGDEDDSTPQPMTAGLDIFKYEIVKMCLDKLLFTGENKDMDSDLLLKKDEESTASYALAFNTLMVHKIIKKYEGKY